MATSVVEGLGNPSNPSYVRGTRPFEAINCFQPKLMPTNGIWQEKKPLQFSLVLFFTQLLMVTLTKQLLVFVLKPLRQPTIIAEVLAGILLGPSMMSRVSDFGLTYFPEGGVSVLETLSHVGLLYHIFLVAVKMDISIIKATGLKAVILALICISLPILIAYNFSVNLKIHTFIGSYEPSQIFSSLAQVLVLGVAFSITAFPVIVSILTDLKLLGTEVGKLSMASAILIEMSCWIILVIAFPLTDNIKSWEEIDQQTHSYVSLLVIISGLCFVFFVIYVIRPILVRLVDQPKGDSFNNYLLCVILTIVLLCSFISEVIGFRSIFGPFVFGLVIPKGKLVPPLVEKVEFVTELFLPLYFLVSGLRTDIWSLSSKHYHWKYLLATAMGTSAIKVAVIFLIGLFKNMKFHDGITLGLLLNTKGVLTIVVLNLAMDEQILDQETFTVLVIELLVMTAIVSPILTMIYKSARSFTTYRHRTFQKLAKGNVELRILACVHTPRNVPTIINLLESSHPNKDSPISVYGLHLVELTDCTSAMLVVHSNDTRNSNNQTQNQSDQIIHNAFQNYQQNTSNVYVQTLTSISSYATIHEDVCTLAEDKRVAFIVLPFHKQQTIDGGMEELNPAFRTINQNVLANAPCSVGILLDRGLTNNNTSHYIAMLFFGGPDDREALSYAKRMAEQPDISLTVLRFLPGDDLKVEDSYQQTSLSIITEKDREKHSDDEFIRKFRMKSALDEKIVFKEMVVNSVEDTVEAIRSLDSIHDLYIVGRGQTMSIELIVGLNEWSECPELGVIGDMLASSDFGATMSVLVVQQYGGGGTYGGSELGTPDSQQSSGKQFNRNFNRLSPEWRN